MKTLGDGTWWSGPLKTLGNALVCSMFLFCSRGPVPSSLPQLRWLWVHNDRGAGRIGAEERIFQFPWFRRPLSILQLRWLLLRSRRWAHWCRGDGFIGLGRFCGHVTLVG